MELDGLGRGLHRLYPNHDFTTIGKFDAMPGADAEPLPEFTTAQVTDKDALEPESVLRRHLIPKLAGTLLEGFDVVVLLSDLELMNVTRARHVCDIVKHAVRLHLQDRYPQNAAMMQQRFQERASFHLAVPMTDAWLFGDPDICAKNEIPLGQSPRLVIGRDRERFLTDDPDYEVDDGSACQALAERASRGANRRKAPWVTDRRNEHPKHYLQWLCRDPSENQCTKWKERGSGARALAELDWQAVLNQLNEYAFLHALVQDLADALGESEPFPPALRQDVPTRIRPIEQRTYLRNQ